jgi:prolyl oligopeptidase
MRSPVRFVPLLLLLVAAVSGNALAQWSYPPTHATPVTDTYFGVSVTDSYRWLENVDDPGVRSWLKAQADFTAGILDRIPGRDSLLADFVRLDAMKPANISSVTRKNGRYFYKKTLASERVGRLFYREGIQGKETLLFDPTAGAGGKSVSISFYEVTEDGKKVAIGVAEEGSESATIRILNVDTGRFYPESIAPCWQGVGGWTKDGLGFTYNLMNSTDVHAIDRELNTKTYYHAVGTDQKRDAEILSAARYPALGMKPQDIPLVTFSADFRWIFAIAASVQNELTLFVAPAGELLGERIAWRPLLKPDDGVVSFVTHGDEAYLLSHEGAARYKIVATSLLTPDVAGAAEIMPQGPTTIDGLVDMKDYLLATTTDGINNRLYRYAFADRKWEEVALPRKGTALVSNFDITSNDGQVILSSWSKPTERYEIDAAKGALALSALNVPVTYPGTDDIVVEEVEAPGQDGTPVPLSIVYNRKLVRDGSANCYLTGYGAYGISNPPYFDLMNLGLVNRGVIVATAHVRGGGEKGHDWYQAGYKATKPNTWRDFISCAEYLERNRYSSPEKLFGEGTSAGGVLIGRAITERPDVFGAAICNVPCANMLREENSPNGPINVPEFGTVKDSAECRAVLEMDALSHVRPGTRYPAVICVGGLNDPRVIVWQPAKFAAALQGATSSGRPVLLQVNYDSGHFTEDKKVTFRNWANMFSFCLWQTGHPQFKMAGPN